MWKITLQREMNRFEFCGNKDDITQDIIKYKIVMQEWSRVGLVIKLMIEVAKTSGEGNTWCFCRTWHTNNFSWHTKPGVHTKKYVYIFWGINENNKQWTRQEKEIFVTPHEILYLKSKTDINRINKVILHLFQCMLIIKLMLVIIMKIR